MSNSIDLTGRSVNSLVFGTLGEQKLGIYHQVDSQRWVELSSSHTITARFEETHRDDWSVYLFDVSRQVRLQLDLHRKIIGYSDANSPQRDQYRILSAQVVSHIVGTKAPLYGDTGNLTKVVNGRTANSVRFGDMGSSPLGYYWQADHGKWIEIGEVNGTINSQASFCFNEINRDDWSVYLHDISREVYISLDLHRKVVVYRHKETTFDLYKILNASTFQREPDRLNHFTNNSIHTIDVGQPGILPLGQFKKTGLFSWVKLAPNGKVLGRLTEIGRYLERIILYDANRFVTLEFDFRKKNVVYTDASNTRFILYSIL